MVNKICIKLIGNSKKEGKKKERRKKVSQLKGKNREI
jgi:hypothetical protein